MSIYDNTAPFGTLITPGVVSIRLHTCCAFQVAHLYDAGVISRPYVTFPAKFLEMSEKRLTLRAILGHLLLSDPKKIINRCRCYLY